MARARRYSLFVSPHSHPALRGPRPGSRFSRRDIILLRIDKTIPENSVESCVMMSFAVFIFPILVLRQTANRRKVSHTNKDKVRVEPSTNNLQIKFMMHFLGNGMCFVFFFLLIEL